MKPHIRHAHVHTVKTFTWASKDEKSGVPNSLYFINPSIFMKKILLFGKIKKTQNLVPFVKGEIHFNYA